MGNGMENLMERLEKSRRRKSGRGISVTDGASG